MDVLRNGTAAPQQQKPPVQSTSRAPRRKKKTDSTLARVLRVGMLFCGGLIVLLGTLLMLLPLFKIQKIPVSGNSYYSAAEIISAAGVNPGDELFACSLNEVKQGILNECLYIERVTVSSRPSGLRIEVTEYQNVRYTKFNGIYFSFDENFRVLEKRISPFEEFPYMELPLVKSLSMGGIIKFENADLDLSYIQTLTQALETKGILSSVTALDVSDRFHLSYTLNGKCRVELGDISALEVKLTLAEQAIAENGAADKSGTLDVSDAKKASYRAGA